MQINQYGCESTLNYFEGYPSYKCKIMQDNLHKTQMRQFGLTPEFFRYMIESKVEEVVRVFGVALDKKNIGELLKDFYTLTGTRIAFCSQDFKEYIAEPKDICSFCSILRKDGNADKKCRECDRHAFEYAAHSRGLYVYECHAGLTEGVAPVVIEDKLLGYLMMGQTLRHIPDEQHWDNVYSRCRNFNVDFDSLKEAFLKLTHVEWEKIYAAARIMDISAKFIHLSNFIKVQEPSLLEKIKNYIESNMNNAVTISDMSRSLSISKSYLSHRIKSEFKRPFTRYLQDKRIEKAKIFLEQTDLDISRISEMVGFSDPNYFARIFKRATGSSATQYRISCKKKAELC